MRKMLFLLLLVPVIGNAQSDESINAFLKSRPEGLGEIILLPDPGYTTYFNFFSSEGREHAFVYVITSDSVYHSIFSKYRFTKDSLKVFVNGTDSSWYNYYLRYLVDSLPVIDFSKQELVAYAACGQCLAFCNHHGEKNEPCHRNGCYFMKTWYIREKEPLLTKETEKKIF